MPQKSAASSASTRRRREHLDRRSTTFGLAVELGRAGYSTLHSRDLPKGNRTGDAEIAELANRHERWVVTKDADFVAGHVLRARPRRLLLISIGNGSNRELIPRVVAAVRAIEAHHPGAVYVELSKVGLVIHG